MMTVEEVMTTDVVTLDRNATLNVAEEIMAQERIRHLVIVDDGRVVGVLSQRDMFRGALANALGYGTRGQDRVLASLRIKEVMSTDLFTASRTQPVAEAAQLMREHKIGCLPVMDEHKLVGIITEGTFVALAATGAL